LIAEEDPDRHRKGGERRRRIAIPLKIRVVKKTQKTSHPRLKQPGKSKTMGVLENVETKGEVTNRNGRRLDKFLRGNRCLHIISNNTPPPPPVMKSKNVIGDYGDAWTKNKIVPQGVKERGTKRRRPNRRSKEIASENINTSRKHGPEARISRSRSIALFSEDRDEPNRSTSHDPETNQG